MKLLSKIYKSACISIGAPKHILNVFQNEEKPKPGEDAIIEQEPDSLNPEGDADTIIEDAKQMYLKIIEEANFEALKIVDTANDEAQKLMAASKEEGYKEGFENGYLEGKKEAKSIIDEASDIREFLDRRRESLYKEAEENILTIVLNIAEKIIGEEITHNKETLLSIINSALQKCAFKKNLILRLSPEDVDFAIKNKDRICMMVEGLSDIDIVSDLSLAEGSCIVETPSGDINSSVEIQMEEIKKIFAYLLRNE